MSDSSDPEPASSDSATPATPGTPSSTPLGRRPGGTGRDRLTLATVLVAVLAAVATGLSLWAVLRPASGGAPQSHSDGQRADAKKQICTAFETVHRGVSRNTTLVVPGGAGDVTGTLAVAANARISLYDGGQYLLARLDPATSPELADAVRGFANGLMDIGAAATAGVADNDSDQTARLHSAEESNTQIAQLCA
jgi:hypothetical protein